MSAMQKRAIDSRKKGIGYSFFVTIATVNGHSASPEYEEGKRYWEWQKKIQKSRDLLEIENRVAALI